MGSDQETIPIGLETQFQSTLPGWGATFVEFSRAGSVGFQSTLPGWGATRGEGCQTVFGRISIHAPRMGSDPDPCVADRVPAISIHAPRMGSDLPVARRMGRDQQFQSTLPGWGATRHRKKGTAHLGYFNPRSPDGERQSGAACRGRRFPFQSTLPGWGATLPCMAVARPRRNFNPRSPDGERHALPTLIKRMTYFNPRSPDGERRKPVVVERLEELFQSTLPGWGATMSDSTDKFVQTIFQSTLPGWGATAISAAPRGSGGNFNPRSPDGERPGGLMADDPLLNISIHAPRMGSDTGICLIEITSIMISIHAPRMGSDIPTLLRWLRYGDFNPRSPDGERPFLRVNDNASGYFNPRSPDGERLSCVRDNAAYIDISIHAPRMGSDLGSKAAPWATRLISIHAPRMGSDRENGHLRPRYGQNHPFSTLIVSQIVVDVLGTVRKSQKTPAH